MKTHSDELTLFVAVVEAGSFRQAAENLGMDNSVVSRGIKRLEEKLATVLLNRTTRRVSPDRGGELVLSAGGEDLTEMSEAEGVAADAPGSSRRACAGGRRHPFILHGWCPSSAGFAAATRHRAATARLRGFINLMERRVDMAIRIGELTDSSLRACRWAARGCGCWPPRLSEGTRCPAPSRLDFAGWPRAARFLHPDHLNRWPLLSEEQGDRFAITPTLRASSGKPCVSWRWRAGIVCLSDFMTGMTGRAGAGGGAGPQQQRRLAPIHAVFFSDAQRDVRLRVWLDFLKEQLGAEAL